MCVRESARTRRRLSVTSAWKDESGTTHCLSCIPLHCHTAEHRTCIESARETTTEICQMCDSDCTVTITASHVHRTQTRARARTRAHTHTHTHTRTHTHAHTHTHTPPPPPPKHKNTPTNIKGGGGGGGTERTTGGFDEVACRELAEPCAGKRCQQEAASWDRRCRLIARQHLIHLHPNEAVS